MCSPVYSRIKHDAANELAAIVGCYTAATPTNDEIRHLIRTRWDDLKRLAHAIHNEEMESLAVKRERRKLRAEADGYAKYGD